MMGPCACARACVWERVRGWTAEPAAGARGMQYPVESNGTFKETAHQQANQQPEASRAGGSRRSLDCSAWSHFKFCGFPEE